MKILSKIVGAFLGIVMAVGTGFAIAAGSKEATPVYAANEQTIIIDGSQLTSTATTEATDKVYGNYTICFSDGAKLQSSSGTNKFTSSAILIGKSGKYIYNKTALPDNVTKFEIYANKGASAKVSVGVNFSATAISAYDSTLATTYTATLSTLDNVYDCSSKLASNTKYFWYQVTNANNSQVQFRITYTSDIPVDPVTTEHAGTAADPYTVADAYTAIDNSLTITNVYTSGIISQIDSYNSSYHSITYWISDDGTTNNQLEVYSGKGLNNTNFSGITDIIIGASVTVYGNLQKHNSTYEYNYNNYLTAYDASGLTPADPIPEPVIATKTVTEFIALENVKTAAYLVSGEITAFKNGSTKDKYGNMTITDGTSSVLVYGSTIHTSALTWNELTGEYKFTNPQSFITTEYTNALSIGDTISIILVRNDYNTTVEGEGVIIASCSGWAKIFLTSITCDATGATSPTFTNTWAKLEEIFNDIPSDQQAELTAHTIDLSRYNVIDKAIERYDYIVGKYGTATYKDFIGRNPAPLSSARVLNGLDSVSNTAIPVIVLLAVLSLTSVGAYLFLKKKKEN